MLVELSPIDYVSPKTLAEIRIREQCTFGEREHNRSNPDRGGDTNQRTAVQEEMMIMERTSNPYRSLCFRIIAIFFARFRIIAICYILCFIGLLILLRPTILEMVLLYIITMFLMIGGFMLLRYLLPRMVIGQAINSPMNEYPQVPSLAPRSTPASTVEVEEATDERKEIRREQILTTIIQKV